MLNSEKLALLVEAVADGQSPDWDLAESGAVGEVEREFLRNLRAAAQIGMGRAMLYTSSLTSEVLEPAAALAPESTWGSLRIVEKVGRGHFGTVYRAWEPTLHRHVALKLLRRRSSEVATDDTQVVQEGRLMARVRHPNVATIYGAQTIDGQTGLWMEFVEGRTLEADLREHGVMDAADLTRIGIELAGALQAVHEAGLVHRDVKAQNVLRESSGRVVLGDFGTGRELEDGETTGAELAGTPVYLAPEVFDKQAATSRSDLYSLGVLLFHLATGTYPVRGRTLAELREAHKHTARISLRQLRTDLPEPLVAAIETAIDADQTCRFSDAAAMAAALSASQAAPATAPSRLARVFWPAAAAVLLGAVLLLTAAFWRGQTVTPPVAFGARDWVLVAAFDNRTGEPLLDGTVEYALQRELANSSFVNVVPHERVVDTLLLMRQPAETRIDAAVGREIALRDGQIRVVVAGRIETSGSSYSLSANILNPADGSIFGTLSETAPDRKDILETISRLAIGVRKRLGEALPDIEASRSRLPKVTTTSFRALQLYAQVAAMENDVGPFGGRASAAEQLLREVVREDPNFASAHMRLSIAVRATDPGRRTEALEHLKRAVGASDYASPIERLINLAEFHALSAGLSADPKQRQEYQERATAGYLAALQLQPDHHQALVCLTNIYQAMERSDLAITSRLADLRPNNAWRQAQAAYAAVLEGSREPATHYARRAAQLPIISRAVAWSAWARLFDAHQAWLDNQPDDALAVADRVASELGLLPAATRSTFAQQLSHLYLTLGQLQRADEMVEEISLATRPAYATFVAMARGDQAVLRETLARDYPDIAHASNVVSALIDAGMLTRARQGLAVLKKRPNASAAYIDLVEGQLAIAEGHLRKGIERLQPLVTDEPAVRNRLRAAQKVAEAWERLGDLPRAVKVLETVSESRKPLILSQLTSWGFAWLAVRDQLAQLYRKAGRVSDADAVDAELRTLLAVADDDHPIKQRLVATAATGGGSK